jgi:hypothetical protein
LGQSHIPEDKVKTLTHCSGGILISWSETVKSGVEETFLASELGSRSFVLALGAESYKDKVMQNDLAAASSPVSHSRAPEIIFANWREMLNQLKLDRPLE